MGLLQEPGEALGALAPDTAGNLVRWMRALDEGQIQPRTNILPETRSTCAPPRYCSRIRAMPLVRFPHRQHTAWLDCTNCHNHLFEQKAGATKINMMAILSGEKCGVAMAPWPSR